MNIDSMHEQWDDLHYVVMSMVNTLQRQQPSVMKEPCDLFDYGVLSYMKLCCRNRGDTVAA